MDKQMERTAKEDGMLGFTPFGLNYIIRNANDFSKETVKEAELALMYRKMGV